MAQPLKQPAPGPLHHGSETFACSIVGEIAFLVFFCLLIHYIFLILRIFIDVFFVFMFLGGTASEDTSVCQLTEDLVEWYSILYNGPRFLSEEEVDRPLFLLSLSVSLFV